MLIFAVVIYTFFFIVCVLFWMGHVKMNRSPEARALEDYYDYQEWCRKNEKS